MPEAVGTVTALRVVSAALAAAIAVARLAGVRLVAEVLVAAAMVVGTTVEKVTVQEARRAAVAVQEQPSLKVLLSALRMPMAWE